MTHGYRSGTVNSNTVNSKFHLIRSYCEIFFYNFPNIACLKYTVTSNFHLIRSKTLLTNNFELTIPDLYVVCTARMDCYMCTTVNTDLCCKSVPSGGSKGGGRFLLAPSPMHQNFLNFMQFFGKIWQIRMLAPPWRVGAPYYGIRPWYPTCVLTRTVKCISHDKNNDGNRAFFIILLYLDKFNKVNLQKIQHLTREEILGTPL